MEILWRFCGDFWRFMGISGDLWDMMTMLHDSRIAVHAAHTNIVNL